MNIRATTIVIFCALLSFLQLIVAQDSSVTNDTSNFTVSVLYKTCPNVTEDHFFPSGQNGCDGRSDKTGLLLAGIIYFSGAIHLLNRHYYFNCLREVLDWMEVDN
eukprot:TRINITY_DN25587_c0_g1_i1.p1 TRINITY_DN25587_c0_g1~~TRINITY_DN25587_c0_g1_i1.p1  ORF type:complete len:105 (-),score=10.62 TRINITY_DN25587_c0_g1_i1:125-439(-)